MNIDTSRIMALRTAIVERNTALQRAAGITPEEAAPTGGVTGFGAAMRAAVNEVNALQAQSSAAAASYERGDTTDIAAVMLARQKASLGFEATLQARNKLLSAYKDIMSMPV